MFRVWSTDRGGLRGSFVGALGVVSLLLYVASYAIRPDVWDARFTLADWIFEGLRLLLAIAVAHSWSQYVFRKETGWLFGAPLPQLRRAYQGLMAIKRISIVLITGIAIVIAVFNRIVVPMQLRVDVARDFPQLSLADAQWMYLPYLPICLINYCFFFPIVFGAPLVAVYYTCAETRSVAHRAKQIALSGFSLQDTAAFEDRLLKYRTYLQADANRFLQYLVLWYLLGALRYVAGSGSIIGPAREMFWYSQAVLSLPAAIFFGALTVYGWMMSRLLFGLQRRRLYDTAERFHAQFRPGLILKRAIEYNMIMIVIIAITPVIVEILF